MAQGVLVERDHSIDWVDPTTHVEYRVPRPGLVVEIRGGDLRSALNNAGLPLVTACR